MVQLYRKRCREPSTAQQRWDSKGREAPAPRSLYPYGAVLLTSALSSAASPAGARRALCRPSSCAEPRYLGRVTFLWGSRGMCSLRLKPCALSARCLTGAGWQHPKPTGRDVTGAGHLKDYRQHEPLLECCLKCSEQAPDASCPCSKTP